MKKLLFVFLISFVLVSANEISSPKDIFYKVDVTNPSDDLFHVSVYVDGLALENSVYNFASNVPGTYQISDYGRFVKSFQAYDKKGRELGTTRLSTNRWRIRNSENVSKIVYSIEDTYDAYIDSNLIYPMSGTGIQEDFIVLNTAGVLGFFDGMQSNPVILDLNYKKKWDIGTSLRKNEKGYFVAETYDRLADSPILIGELTQSQLIVNDIEVNIHAYSTIPDVDSDFILSYAEEVLLAAGDFIGYSPVPNYDFLFALLNYDDFVEIAPKGGGGALEHSLSSFYFLTGEKEDVAQLKHIMSHEFLHILTPLHLHSEIIHYYNFKKPTPSQHIWLYEGVTEWGAGMMQLHGGIFTIDDYLKNLTKKILTDEIIDKNSELSLIDMSKGSFNPDTSQYFYNFYQKGALTANLLDILLLDESDGNYGLKELYLELLDDYGKSKPFPENELFDIIERKTSPNVRTFIDNHIVGTQPLPLKNYFNIIGINYYDSRPSVNEQPWFGFRFLTRDENKYFIAKLSDYALGLGLQKDDQIIDIFGIELNGGTKKEILEKRNNMQIGDPFDLTVLRDGESISVKGNLQRMVVQHVFEINSEANERQKLLRSKWSGLNE